jgi:NHL repeat
MSALLLAVLWAAGVWPAFSQTSGIYAWTNFVGQPGASGTNDGTGSAARFYYPFGVAVDSADNVFVADWGNNRVSTGTPIYPWITLEFDGTHVQLSWPAAYLSWELEGDTNLSGVGLSTNWFPLPGSTTNTQMSIPIDPASPSMFYRLHQQ